MKSKLGLAITVAIMGLIPLSSPKSAHAALTAADFCNSTRFKSIVEAVNCKRDNCGDDGKLNDYIYICTQVDPSDADRLGAYAVRIDTSEDTRLGALTRVNASYPTLEALQALRLDPPPKLKELSPCECLAAIEAQTKCGVEQCPPEKPAEVPPPPPAEANSDKAQTPEEAPAGNNVQPAISGGGLCALGYKALPGPAATWIGFGLLNGLLLLGLRREAALKGDRVIKSRRY